jgi:hypothetical protein
MASGPDTLIIPIAPPCAVEMAQMVSCVFVMVFALKLFIHGKDKKKSAVECISLV